MENQGGKRPFGKNNNRKFPGKKFSGKKKGHRKDAGEENRDGEFNRSSGRSSEHTPRRRFNDGKSVGERKSFGEKRNFDKPFRKRDDDRGERKPFGEKRNSDKPFRKRDDDRGERKPFGEKRNFDKPFRKRDDDRGERKPFGEKRNFDKPFRKRDDDRGERKPFGEKRNFDKPFRKRDDDRGERKSFGEKRNFDKPFRKRDDDRGERKPFGEKRNFEKPEEDSFNHERGERRVFRDKPYGNRPGRRRADLDKKKEELGDDWKTFDDNTEAKDFIDEHGASKKEDQGEKKIKPVAFADDQLIRLNRFIANTGLCSRREADDLITAGVIKINGKIITELGTKVASGDVVHYGDQPLHRESLAYVLLNKPKDYITTTDDPQERKTVLHLVEGAGSERIYPVGRLDRQTTGLLLLTNDGDLATRLMHPRYGIRKIYHVSLDKNLRTEDFDAIVKGVELEDGFIKADELSFVGDGSDKKEIGLVLHSGRNRIVRRLFEHLGYIVLALDRVVYAGLTKKNLPRGRWRMLSQEEVGFLKMQVGGVKKANPRSRGRK
ncbi:MAG: pseudouridine synthase [Bacteroidetes bacterium]|nr:pseudouridine synthase [Bacteroidota bacterium]